MLFGRIERQKEPNQAPQHADGTAGVEHIAPAEIFDDKATNGIGETDTNAESLKAGHESAALFGRYPVADNCVHCWPC